MSDNQDFHVELVERDLVNIKLIEKDFVDVKLKVIDIIHSIFDVQVIQDHFIYNEVPSKLTTKRFQTAENYISGTLRVYLNGVKELYITEESNNTFLFEIDTIVTDEIEVNYIKT